MQVDSRGLSGRKPMASIILMYFAIGSALGWVSSPAGAASVPSPSVWRLERVSAAGLVEQSAFVFETKQVRVTRNSNFACGAQAEVWLGDFARPLSDADRTQRDYVEQLRIRHRSIEVPRADAASHSRGRSFL